MSGGKVRPPREWPSPDRFPRPLGDDFIRPAERVPVEFARPLPLHVVLLLIMGAVFLVLLAIPDAAEWISTWPACRP